MTEFELFLLTFFTLFPMAMAHVVYRYHEKMREIYLKNVDQG